ncbi:MAG: hypothetical protein ACI32N_07960 [Bulleidia sp.]
MRHRRFRTIVFMVLTFLFAVSFLTVQIIRDRIHDIHAIPLNITPSNDTQAMITATDAAYNWAKDCLMFSIEVQGIRDTEAIQAKWLAGDGSDTIIWNSEMQETADTVILTGTLKRDMIAGNAWQLYVTILDENGDALTCANTNMTNSGIPLFTLISD